MSQIERSKKNLKIDLHILCRSIYQVSLDSLTSLTLLGFPASINVSAIYFVIFIIRTYQERFVLDTFYSTSVSAVCQEVFSKNFSLQTGSLKKYPTAIPIPAESAMIATGWTFFKESRNRRAKMPREM